NRGLIQPTPRKIWAFLGDGETDEPESMGSITLGSREKLDNLIFVVNCNLQRLDGPVRGNGKIIQELEALFRGAGWNVIKVVGGGADGRSDSGSRKDREGVRPGRFRRGPKPHSSAEGDEREGHRVFQEPLRDSDPG